ncbi:transmembrane protein 186 [Alosa sapidissima]|uniref:transmembrane protein 186 n=1 Tax=Alosa sapidissima TaxID=34773 RepID=UPI001C090940|nr:transmembrane protein 186 [Alosa sapidissima]XP_041959498.1 transmembrane protein 186 [Alosa sapidissima]XP_041959499.1 transmembrane protein 186 [Alosa sapidissima]XP_041959500.1 transmembrane protein 186 [Alosa sapidissima]XP_041959501.1 transmembrane protein 186 [Alosa sapidissima]XP_041959502.1 transmembrane protein 186 [Alosa sapidissima]
MLKSIQLGRFAISPVIQCRGHVYCAKGSGVSQVLRRIPAHSHSGLFTRPALPYVGLQSAPLLYQHQIVAHCADLSSQKYTLIYALPTITILRALSRLKLIQTGITVVMLPPVYYLFLQGELSLTVVNYSTGIAAFAAVMLYSISQFARRVVGRMYLDSSGTTLKVSHLTFWGRRNDLYMPVNDVMTFGDVGDSPNETILYFKRYSTTDIMYFSTRFGRVVDKRGFEKVFGTLI